MTSARALAVAALVRIDEGVFANLVVPALLAETDLVDRDRAFATELIYGATRMRRACDFLVDRFVGRTLQPEVRAVLRLGAYQLSFLQTPPHAAVSAMVSEAPERARGLVNAILRKVASNTQPGWPDDATRLSYPDWVVARLVNDLGRTDAMAALTQMNAAPAVHVRPDGYTQDPASQAVGNEVGVEMGDLTADLCAAPGGKATAMAAAGASLVVAGDRSASRAALVSQNARALGYDRVAVVVADGRYPPLRPDRVDRVLVDAPCTGLGVLRRRPDARWRVKAGDVRRLGELQRELLAAAALAVRPGGTVTYSVCTLTLAETGAIDRWLATAHPALEPLPPPSAPWQPVGRGARLLPQAAGTDGMYLLKLRRR